MGCFRGVFQRGVSEGCFRRVFQRGVSEGCFRPLGGSPERVCVMSPGGNSVKIPPPEGQIGPGTSTERFRFENQCRRWPRRPCGQLGVFIFSDDVGKTSFPAGGLSEGCFRGAFQRGVSEGCFRHLGLRDRPAQGNFGTHPYRARRTIVGGGRYSDDRYAGDVG